MVAHPDDETLWAGGTLLLHPEWACRIATLCRASDANRAPKFYRVAARYDAAGAMGDLDDGAAQTPLADEAVQQAVLALLGTEHYDLLLTHGPDGEYTWHRRHVEVSRAVAALWLQRRLHARAVWMFAYEDGQRAYFPRAVPAAEVQVALPEHIWAEKYRLVHEWYDFSADSWEAGATPCQEAFWRFDSPERLAAWLSYRRCTDESPHAV